SSKLGLKLEIEVDIAGEAHGFAGESRWWEEPVTSGLLCCSPQQCRAFGVGDPDFSVLVDDGKNADCAGDAGALGHWRIGGHDPLTFGATERTGRDELRLGPA